MMQVYDQLLASPKPGGRAEAMMMLPMPYDRRRVRATSSWQAPGFAGGAVLKAVCCQVPRRPGLSLVRLP
jgi:hypothetical protein